MTEPLVRPFALVDTDGVVGLWERCGLVRPWNDPRKDIERMLQVQPELFLVAEAEDAVIPTAMAGYDGHRGWVWAHGAGSAAPQRRRGGRATGTTSPCTPVSGTRASGAG